MMRFKFTLKRLLFFKIYLFLFSPIAINAQNLVPNYSFEDTARRVTPLFLPADWYAATNEGFNYLTQYNNLTPQHFSFSAPQNIFGFQKAKTGNSYLGFLIYHLWGQTRNPRREYAQVKLTRNLVQDSTYCLQLYLSLADSSRFASRNQFGVYFSNQKTTLNTYENLPVIPQIIISPTNFVSDKVNWIEYNFQYKALGGENYITLGNFNDTTAIDTMLVGVGNPSNIDHLNTYYYLDDVWLSHCDSLPDSTIGISEKSLQTDFSIYPNPAQNTLHFKIQNPNSKVYSVKILDISGSVKKVVQNTSNHSVSQYDLTGLPAGLYFLSIETSKGQVNMKFIKR